MLSDIFGRNKLLVAIGNLYVIAENLVIFNAEIFNSCAFSFLRLDFGDKAVSVLSDKAERIDLLVVTLADNVAVL